MKPPRLCDISPSGLQCPFACDDDECLLAKAVKAQREDKRTQEEKIKDGVAFITDTRVGGD